MKRRRGKNTETKSEKLQQEKKNENTKMELVARQA